MRKLLTIATIATLFISQFAHAQTASPKKKQFVFDQKTMTEAGLSEEQKKTIEDNRTQYRKVRTVYETEVAKLNTIELQRLDSALTADQKQKVARLKQTIEEENKVNPTARKTFAFNQKTLEDLGLSAEQQKAMMAIRGQINMKKRSLSDEFGKVTTKAVKEQDDVLTAEQKKKVEDMKSAVVEYNKTIQ